MSVRDDFRKITADLRTDLRDGDEHLGWLLAEVERHLDLSDERSAEPVVAPVVEDQDSTDETEDLSKLTVGDLKAHASDNGIDLGNAKAKADIIAVIEAAGAEPDGGGDQDSTVEDDETEDEN